MYVKVLNGVVDQYPYTIKMLREDNSSTSFPKNIAENTLNAWGVYAVVPTEKPSFNPITQYVTMANPILVDGVWKQVWTVTTRNSQEQNSFDAEKTEYNRALRDLKIAETDWWASSDLTMTAEQTAYRQALRDITAHANWPHLEESDWPTKP
jgi:hypothetical protein